jgi:hypothetical protein
MAVKIQLRRGTAAQWTAANPILYEGEFGFETDNRRYKIGDGVHAWNDSVNLPYYATGTLTGITTASGSGLSGGGLSGTLTLAVDPSVVITKDYVDGRGDLITATTNNTPALLSLGTDGQVLIADTTNGANTKGIKWGQITAAGITNDAVTTVKILDYNVTAGKLASDSVTTVKIVDSNVTLAKLATAVQNLLIPAGTIAATVKATADTGWQFMGQTLTNAETLYPALFAAAPTSWRTGTVGTRNLVLPSMTDRTLLQAGTTTLGVTGGSATITEANLPAHVHTVNPPNTSVSITDPGHNHSVTNGTLVVRQDGGGDAKLTANSSYGPYNTYTVSNVSNTTGISATVDIAQFNSGSVGSGNAYYQPHLAVNYQIKAH